jgi:hypothetical protein
VGPRGAAIADAPGRLAAAAASAVRCTDLPQSGATPAHPCVARYWASHAVSIGREVLWLHTYGSRFGDPAAGRMRSERAVVERFGVKCLAPVRSLPEQLPERLVYDPEAQSLFVGNGVFAPVQQEVIDYTVSGRRVVWRWLNDRTMRPRNKRRSSELDDIRPTSWNRDLTFEFLALLSVLTGCVRLHPEQERLLSEVCTGPLISKDDLDDAGVLPVTAAATKPPKPAPPGSRLLPETDNCPGYDESTHHGS